MPACHRVFSGRSLSGAGVGVRIELEHQCEVLNPLMCILPLQFQISRNQAFFPVYRQKAADARRMLDGFLATDAAAAARGESVNEQSFNPDVCPHLYCCCRSTTPLPWRTTPASRILQSYLSSCVTSNFYTVPLQLGNHLLVEFADAGLTNILFRGWIWWYEADWSIVSCRTQVSYCCILIFA